MTTHKCLMIKSEFIKTMIDVFLNQIVRFQRGEQRSINRGVEGITNVLDIGVVEDLVLLEDFGAVIGVDIDNDITVVHEVDFTSQSVGISARQKGVQSLSSNTYHSK